MSLVRDDPPWRFIRPMPDVYCTQNRTNNRAPALAPGQVRHDFDQADSCDQQQVALRSERFQFSEEFHTQSLHFITYGTWGKFRLGFRRSDFNVENYIAIADRSVQLLPGEVTKKQNRRPRISSRLRDPSLVVDPRAVYHCFRSPLDSQVERGIWKRSFRRRFSDERYRDLGSTTSFVI